MIYGVQLDKFVGGCETHGLLVGLVVSGDLETMGEGCLRWCLVVSRHRETFLGVRLNLAGLTKKKMTAFLETRCVVRKRRRIYGYRKGILPDVTH